MRRRFSSILSTTFAALCFIGTASLQAQSYSHIVAFGDSLSDEGNTINLFRGMGLDTGDLAEYDDDYYNADYNDYNIPAAGRFSNGSTWVEYFNGRMQGGSATSAPIALGRAGLDGSGPNFAWAGSTSGTGNSKIFLANLQTQVAGYSATSFASSASSTLFTVWSGGNDAINWVKDYTPSGPTLEQATTEAAQNIALAITTLYNMGGRTFLVPNLPALGFKPDFIGTVNETLANNFAEMFNFKLSAELGALTLDGLHLVELDIYSIFNTILQDPAAYGFSNSDEMAYTYDPDGSIIVGNPEEYIFWDNTHPTTQMHQILGNYAYDTFAAAIPEPSTYVLMGVGCALGFWLRRRQGERLAA